MALSTPFPAGDPSDPYGLVRGDLEIVAAKVRELASAAAPPLGEAATALADRSGKLVRPALLLLSARFGPPAPPARDFRRKTRLLAAATSLELLHLASLTHDDILDGSSVRRGGPSVWGRWGTAVAILTGDHLYGKAVGQMALAGRRASRSLCRVIDALLAGQALELRASGRKLGRRAYLTLASAKTAVFCAEACGLGATLAGAGRETAAALRAFGTSLGQAYQLVDDLLDWTGDPDRTGKPLHLDLPRGHLNLPVIIALERRPARVGRAVATLRQAPGPQTRPATLAELLALLRECGALEETARLARLKTLRAVARLSVLPMNPARRSLEALALALVGRAS